MKVLIDRISLEMHNDGARITWGGSCVDDDRRCGGTAWLAYDLMTADGLKPPATEQLMKALRMDSEDNVPRGVKEVMQKAAGLWGCFVEVEIK